MSKNPELERLMSREKFAAANRQREKEITLPEIGIVRIREFTTDQRKAYTEYLEIGEDGKAHFSNAKQVGFDKFVISMGVITGNVALNGEQGGLMFQDAEDVPDMRFDVAEILTHEILELSGIHTNAPPAINPTTSEPATSVTPSP